MNTKPIIHVGIALVLLGFATLIYQAAAYTGVAKGLEANQQLVSSEAALPLSPLVGGLLLAAGVLLVGFGLKSRRGANEDC